MVSKIFIIFIQVLLALEPGYAQAQTWIRVGYYIVGNFPISGINSSLFTHLICGFADINFTSYQLSFSPSEEKQVSGFTETVKQKNSSVVTLLSIGGTSANYSTFSSMMSNSSYRSSFVDSSIKIARLYGFQGLDLFWRSPRTSSDMLNAGVLFREWRVATELEARNSSHSQLILTARLPWTNSAGYPVGSIQQNLNWVHVPAAGYRIPEETNFTSPHAALYDPKSVNTDELIKAWIGKGLSANKLVLCLPYFGYAWTLANPEDNGIGAPAIGPAVTGEGLVNYKDIKALIEQYAVNLFFNATYVMNYCTIRTSWIIFDDVKVVEIKVSYAKEMGLLGYYVWRVTNDDNWVLSRAAAQEIEIISSSPDDSKNGQNKRQLLVIILTTTAAAILLLSLVIYYRWIRNLKLKGTVASGTQPRNKASKATAAGDFNSNVPNLKYYTLAETEAATNRFSIENKLGEGGYGPVYKGMLPNGQEIAVKKLSKSSTQGFEEFKNEVMLTAKLLHVNLVRVLGFCIDREEQMLIYDYMPNKSLDHYLFGLVFYF